VETVRTQKYVNPHNYDYLFAKVKKHKHQIAIEQESDESSGDQP
jgi:hypothetical protein